MRLTVFLMLFVTLVFGDGLNNVTSSDDQPEVFSNWPAPCQKVSNQNAFNVFMSKHILQINFDTTKSHIWVDYLTRTRLCGVNPHQSFLHKDDSNSIINICNGGGIRDSQNLCISMRKFKVFIVQSVWRNGRCEVQLQTEIAHVIIACESFLFHNIQIHCVPVYFSGIIYTAPSPRGQPCKI